MALVIRILDSSDIASSSKMFLIYCTSQRAFYSAVSLWIVPISKPALSQNTVFSSTDYSNEKWCRDYFLSCSALRMAEIIRAELVEIMKRIELPISEPDFGSEENILSIKKSLLSGYFMHVRKNTVVSSYCIVKLYSTLSENLN